MGEIDYCLNHVLGCSHGCRYPCYAYLMAKRFGRVRNYAEWLNPQVVENALELLDKEIPKFKDKIKLLHLCFSTDPFMYGHPEIAELSLKILTRANLAGIRCSVLTKGVLPYELAQMPLAQENRYGITLVSLNDKFLERYEPGASKAGERLKALRALHEAGCKTWICIEPYPTPNIIRQNLGELLEAVSFADQIVFGRLNYNNLVEQCPNYEQFYKKCADTVTDFCNRHGINCNLKNKDTATTPAYKSEPAAPVSRQQELDL